MLAHLWRRLGGAAAAALIAVGVGSCSGGGSPGWTGGSGAGVSTIQVWLTDAPTDYDNVWVTITEIAVHMSGGGWVSLPLTTTNADTNGDGMDDVIVNADWSVTVDLLALQGLEALLASGTIEPGHYTQIRLIVTSGEVVEDGVSTPLDIPSGSQTGIKITGEFTVPEGQNASITLDFDAEESIQVRGNGSLALQPSIEVESIIISSNLCMITSLVPNRGPVTGGTLVSVIGDDFEMGADVWFGGNPSPSVVWVSPQRLDAISPPSPFGCIGIVDVIVTNPTAGTCVYAAAWTYINYAPSVGIDPILSPQSGDVLIAYTLFDPDSDYIDITVEWSTDSGATYQPATEDPGPISEGRSNLTSSPSGEPHLFVWDSLSDLGASNFVDVIVRIQATDPCSVGLPDFVQFDVENQ